MQLTFYISTTPLMSFAVDTKNRTATLLTPVEYINEKTAKAIILPTERTYAGIERRLQFYTESNKSLAELIDDIKTNGFVSQVQHNLNIVID